MIRSLLVVTVLVLFPLLASADAKATPKPNGTYVRDIDGRKVSFTFKDSTMTFKMNDLVVTCAYGLADDVVFATVTKVETSGDGPEVRDLFSFQIAIDKNELKISDLRGTSVNEDSIRIVEGTFKKE